MYRTSLKLKNRDVDYYRRLRLSRMMELFQEASIAHTEALGAGREKTLDKGLLWTVFQQRTWIYRLPEYDEEIVVLSWPGKMQHVLFPRFYRIEDTKGNLLAEGSALWILTDSTSRRMVFPEKYGIEVPEEITGMECELPCVVRKEKTEHEALFTVPYSWCDLNRHMNNTRYYDLAEDTLPFDVHAQTPKEICCEYINEIPYGTQLKVEWIQKDGTWYLSFSSEKTCFRMRIVYTCTDAQKISAISSADSGMPLSSH
jgi:acyl-ACP thioesterase